MLLYHESSNQITLPVLDLIFIWWLLGETKILLLVGRHLAGSTPGPDLPWLILTNCLHYFANRRKHKNIELFEGKVQKRKMQFILCVGGSFLLFVFILVLLSSFTPRSIYAFIYPRSIPLKNSSLHSCMKFKPYI